jgi:hypothetical protein
MSILTSINPATEVVLNTYEITGAEKAGKAVTVAQKAFEE